ncbi:MAG: hypothetical protein PVH19_04865 [Planctomycetia bacterium]|jgi:hypothetical protein
MTPDDKKPQADNLPVDDDRIYDLLVDGELDDERRRTLLGSLDERPGGWRRCALAFLEAQSWGQEFRSFSARLRGNKETAADDTAPKSVPGKKPADGKRRRKRDRYGTFLGIAASFLLAMGITSLMQDIGTNDGVQRASVIPPVLKPAQNVWMGGLGVSNDTEQAIHRMSITGRGFDGDQSTYSLPALSQKELDQQWLKEMPTVIPDGVVESFQQAGHEVKTSRQLIPFTMRDGRKLIIPVDQVDVHYANTPYYQ